MNDSSPDHVLVVYAHPNPKSFTHAVGDEIVRGLADAGHSSEVLDLYAFGFDPVFSLRDATQFITTPCPMAPSTGTRSSACSSAAQAIRSNASWPSDGRSTRTSPRSSKCSKRTSPRTCAHTRVARAHGLNLVAPVFRMSVPAILKGWLERVFAYGYLERAFALGRVF